MSSVMKKGRIKYALITPAKNEEKNIDRLLKSMISQTSLPEKWIIVSDGSTDRTDLIIKKYLEKNKWINFVRLPERVERNFAAKVNCFNKGYERLTDVSYDILGNIDADISFEPTYFEYLLTKFKDDPELGVAGTPFIEDGKQYNYKFTNIEHVSGACQLFRKECFDEIGGYVPIKGGGIDWVAVTTARMKGWKTKTYTQMKCVHHRKMGTGNVSGLITWFKQGQKDYLLGNHPLWELFRSIYQMTKKPHLICGFLIFCGYLRSFFSCKENVISDELKAFIRTEQMRRLRNLIKL